MAFLSEKLISASGGVEETDDSFNLVTSLYHFDGSNGAQNNTFLDSSSNGFTVSTAGSPTQGTFSPFSSEEGKWSVSFDGTDDYIDVASGATQLGSGDFTVEFWIRTTDTSFNLANPDDSTGSGYWGILMQSGDLRWNDSYAVSNKWVVDGAALTDNQWHHVAIVRASGTFAVYYDGTSQSIQSGSFSDSTNYSGSDVLRIGKGYGAGVLDEFQGFLSNFRTVSGTAVYTSNYSAPTTPLTAITNTKVLVCCSNRFRDKSTNAYAVSTGSVPKIQPFSPFAPSSSYSAANKGGSGFFAAVNPNVDYLSVPTSDDFAFGTGDYTIEAWVLKRSTGQQSIYDGRDATNTNRVLLYVNSANKLANYINASVKGVATSEFPLNEWVHVALVRSGTTGYMFQNGTQVSTWTGDSTDIEKPNSNVYIAQDSRIGVASYPWDGFFSSLRVIKATALYTSAFTPPTAPSTAITNTKLLLNFTNAAMFDQSGKTNVKTVGNAQLDTSVKKFGTASAEFDGTGDYLFLSPQPTLSFPSDFTIEFFFNSDNVSGLMVLLASVSYYTAGKDGNWLIRITNSTSIAWASYNGSSGATAAYKEFTVPTMSTGTWYHLAVVRSSGSINVYFNGTVSSSGALSDTKNLIDGSVTGVYVGTNSLGANANFDGYIDDLRITQKARYTSNFTPPSEEFPNR